MKNNVREDKKSDNVPIMLDKPKDITKPKCKAPPSNTETSTHEPVMTRSKSRLNSAAEPFTPIPQTDGLSDSKPKLDTASAATSACVDSKGYIMQDWEKAMLDRAMQWEPRSYKKQLSMASNDNG